MKQFCVLLLLSLGPVLIVPPATAQPCGEGANCAKPYFEKGLFGIRDASSRRTVQPKYSRAEYALLKYPNSGAHGLIITEIEGKYGFVNREGVETFAPQFTNISSGMHGHFIVKKDGKSCVIDKNGNMILACNYDLVSISENPEIFFVKENGEGRYLTASGNTLVYSQPEPVNAAPPAPPQPSRTLPPEPPKSKLEQLIIAKKWDEAIRAAANAGNAKDIRDVLLIFSRTASASDARYAAGRQALYENIGMIEKGIWASLPMEKRELQKLETGILTWAEGPVSPPSNGLGGFINARTVGECHRSGGTVTVMQQCAR